VTLATLHPKPWMGVKNPSARFGKGMNPLSLPRIEAPIVGGLTRTAFTTPTELTRFPSALLFSYSPGSSRTLSRLRAEHVSSETSRPDLIPTHLLLNGYRGPLTGLEFEADHLHLVHGLRMSGVIPLLLGRGQIYLLPSTTGRSA